MPVLLEAGLAGCDAEAGELGAFAQAALQLGEAGESGQADDVVPEPGRVGFAGEPADDGAEERDTVRWLEVDDRGADVLACQGESLVGLVAQSGVEGLVVQRVGELGGEAGPASAGCTNSRVPR